MKNVAKVANVADYFRTPKRRQFFGGEELVAYDCNQLLTFEENFAHSDLGSRDGKVPLSVLVHVWWKMRDSWERVMLALPPGPDREEMKALLAERYAVMEGFRAKARNLIRLKEVEGNA
jgi:hypothetical protein